MIIFALEKANIQKGFIISDIFLDYNFITCQYQQLTT